jgi:putative flippase GtrA
MCGRLNSHREPPFVPHEPMTDNDVQRSQRGATPWPRSIPRAWASALQIRRFVAVGVLNTFVDYVLFVALTKVLRIPLDWVWVAKLASGTVAISISFYLNRRWVFQATGAAKAQAVKFVATTIIGVYAIQTPMTQVFASSYTDPGRGLYHLLKAVGLADDLPTVVTRPLAIKTAAFALATAASMTFNFLLYRTWVFRMSADQEQPRT